MPTDDRAPLLAMRIIVLIMALASASLGWTAPLNGRALRERCETTASKADREFCSGYLLATAETLSSIRRYYRRKVFNICLSGSEAEDGATLVQLYLSWTSRHPDELQHSANEIAIAALHDAFRCPRR